MSDVQDDMGILDQDEYRRRIANSKSLKHYSDGNQKLEVDPQGEISTNENNEPLTFYVNGKTYQIDSVGSKLSRNIGYFTYVGNLLVRFKCIRGEWQVQDIRSAPMES